MIEIPKPSLSVVVPCYHSEKTLPKLQEAVLETLNKNSFQFELIYIDDGSKDKTWETIESLKHNNPRITGIKLSRNYGQHNALLCGIRAAQNDVIITIDDDLQNPPEEIPRLVHALGDSFDVVYGHPKSETHGIFRNAASRITKFALKSAMGVDSAARVSAFRAFRKDVAKAFDDYKGPFVNIDVLLTWGTSAFTFCTVTQRERSIGTSGYTFKKLVHHAINMMTGFSAAPLHLASVLGLILGFFGILTLMYVIGSYIMLGTSVPGFTFLASLIAIFSGTQLFAIGVFGEYLSRIHFRSMDKPSYSIKAKTSETPTDNGGK